MFSDNQKISTRQFEILMILVLLSGLSLILPRITSEICQQNGWYIILGSGTCAIVYALLITKLGRLFPNESIVEYGPKIVSKPIGFLISGLLLVKFIGYAGLQIRLFAELIKQTLLPRTPTEIIVISMLLFVVYFTRKGIEVRGRLAEMIIFLVLVPIFIVLMFAVKDVNISNLAPFFTVSVSKLFLGSIQISFFLNGLELLYLKIPYMKEPQKSTVAVLKSILFVIIFFVMVYWITVGLFGYKETSVQIWPVITIMQIVDIPGAFMERQDALMTSFWILMTFMAISAYVFHISLLSQKMMRLQRGQFIGVAAVPLIYVAALLPNNVPHIFEWLMRWSYICVAFYTLIPLTLYTVAKIRRLGADNHG